MSKATSYATPDTKPRPAPTKTEDFVNKIKADEEKQIAKYFKNILISKYIIISKNLFEANQVKNIQLLNQAIYSINELRNTVIKKEIPENENPNKIIDIVEKIIDFNNQ